MFTGIVEEMGVVKMFEPTLAGTKLSILAETIMDDLPIGASVSVNGACLTVVTKGTASSPWTSRRKLWRSHRWANWRSGFR